MDMVLPGGSPPVRIRVVARCLGTIGRGVARGAANGVGSHVAPFRSRAIGVVGIGLLIFLPSALFPGADDTQFCRMTK